MPSAEELARVALALEQVRQRIIRRHELEFAFLGDSAALALARASFRPLVNAATDERLPYVEEYPDSRIVANQNI